VIGRRRARRGIATAVRRYAVARRHNQPKATTMNTNFRARAARRVVQ